MSLAADKISAQAKHFAIYGAGGRDGYTPMGGGPSERTVFEVANCNTNADFSLNFLLKMQR